jgi:chromate transport protein ChrA
MADFCVEETTPPSGPEIPRDNPVAPVQRPSFRGALRFWFKLGWISFGGTAAHIAIMHDDLVEKKRWISNESFLHALSHCMILPGPEAQQLAIYIGWKLHGKKGGLVAGALFVLPSMFVLLALSVIYARFGQSAVDYSHVQWLETGRDRTGHPGPVPNRSESVARGSAVVDG